MCVSHAWYDRTHINIRIYNATKSRYFEEIKENSFFSTIHKSIAISIERIALLTSVMVLKVKAFVIKAQRLCFL